MCHWLRTQSDMCDRWHANFRCQSQFFQFIFYHLFSLNFRQNFNVNLRRRPRFHSLHLQTRHSTLLRGRGKSGFFTHQFLSPAKNLQQFIQMSFWRDLTFKISRNIRTVILTCLEAGHTSFIIYMNYFSIFQYWHREVTCVTCQFDVFDDKWHAYISNRVCRFRKRKN